MLDPQVCLQAVKGVKVLYSIFGIVVLGSVSQFYQREILFFVNHSK